MMELKKKLMIFFNIFIFFTFYIEIRRKKPPAAPVVFEKTDTMFQTTTGRLRILNGLRKTIPDVY